MYWGPRGTRERKWAWFIFQDGSVLHVDLQWHDQAPCDYEELPEVESSLEAVLSWFRCWGYHLLFGKDYSGIIKQPRQSLGLVELDEEEQKVSEKH